MKLFLGGFYTFYLPQRRGWVEISLPGPRPLRQVLEQHGIPPAEVYLVAVNRQVVELDEVVVTDEDEVRLYPPVGGGCTPNWPFSELAGRSQRCCRLTPAPGARSRPG